MKCYSKDLCAIVIPVYRQPNAYEKYSFETLINIVKDKYDIYLVCSEDYNTEYFGNKVIVKNLEKKWFESLQSYSNLCRENFFYRLFDKYKYMLIYQLDCLIFRDDIEYWCNEDYDYIGAPIVSNNSGWNNVPVCGNGGLSLRKISYFLNITNENSEFRKKYDSKLAFEPKYDMYNKFEDLYYCEFVAKNWLFNNAAFEQGKIFALDMNPDIIYRGKLPMGCHAFCKNIPFWNKILQFPQEVIDACYKEHGEFIKLYYKENKCTF